MLRDPRTRTIIVPDLTPSHLTASSAHPEYVRHSLATAVNDFLVASGAGAFVKKTLTQTKTILDWAADIATHAALTTGVHGVGAGTVAKVADIAATKIDDLTAGDDNTDLNANTTNHGLVVKAVAPAANVLNVVGIANGEAAYTNKAMLDGTNPADLGVAAPGTSLIASHRDHVHLDPVTAHAGAADPHTGYMLESAAVGARVYHSANQSISTSSLTTLAFNSERYDTDAIHDTVTNNSRLTCQTAGKYLIIFHCMWVAVAGGVRVAQINLGGATVIAYIVLPLVANEAYPMLSTIYDLAVGNYVEALVWQNSGSSVNIYSGANYSPEFMMQRIGQE